MTVSVSSVSNDFRLVMIQSPSGTGTSCTSSGKGSKSSPSASGCSTSFSSRFVMGSAASLFALPIESSFRRFIVAPGWAFSTLSSSGFVNVTSATSATPS